MSPGIETKIAPPSRCPICGRATIGMTPEEQILSVVHEDAAGRQFVVVRQVEQYRCADGHLFFVPVVL
jgi:hypothetical protein